MFSLALLFVLVFLQSFEHCDHLAWLLVHLLVYFAVGPDCGTPWNFLLTF